MKRAAKASRPSRGGEHRPQLARCFEETVALYLRLTATAKQIYRKGDLSGPRRTMLVALARSGPQTVAHLALGRFESRQRVQPLVNALVEQGLLSYSRNPVHRRSPLVTLTPRGSSYVQQLQARESALRAELSLDVTEAELEATASVLHRIREALDADRIAQLIKRTNRTTQPLDGIRRRAVKSKKVG